MELSAVGESVFAAESIIKRRIRRVFAVFFPPPAGCVSASLTQTCAFAVSTRRHLITWLCCGSVFAGSLGISREMEGLVSEVSIITEAVKDSAPSWPLAQLHHHTVWRYSALWMCGLFLKKKNAFHALGVRRCRVPCACWLVCTWQVFEHISLSARWDVLKSTLALAMAEFTMRHCPAT